MVCAERPVHTARGWKPYVFHFDWRDVDAMQMSHLLPYHVPVPVSIVETHTPYRLERMTLDDGRPGIDFYACETYVTTLCDRFVALVGMQAEGLIRFIQVGDADR